MSIKVNENTDSIGSFDFDYVADCESISISGDLPSPNLRAAGKWLSAAVDKHPASFITLLPKGKHD